MPTSSHLGILLALWASFAACTSPPPTQLSTPLPATSTVFPTSPTMPTATPVPSPTALPERIIDAHGTTLLLVPAGEFIMGSESEESFPDEVPVHEVYLDAFYIDLTEVTNKQWQECVDAGACKPPTRVDCCLEKSVGARPDYYDNPEFDDYPVVFISWYDALDYCTWRGARLLTEAEWEKASRGTDGRTYPWGDQEPTPELINIIWSDKDFDIKNSSPVGSFPMGASPYGVLDLAGNVYEWVYDVYAPDYYLRSPYRNPNGPEEGAYRVTRGGSFANQAKRNRSSNRNNAFIPANSVHFDGGARCGMDVP